MSDVELAHAPQRGLIHVRSRPVVLIGVALALGVVLVVLAVLLRPRTWSPAVVSVELTVEEPTTINDVPVSARTVAAYAGMGAWLDAFDYSPAYGVEPDVAGTVREMAASGVQTIYVQSGRLDERSPDLLEDRWVLAELLMRAHDHDVDVVAWFLPKWTDPDADLAHMVAASEFEVLGHRFDGVALDIEWNQDGFEVEERTRRLIALSEQLTSTIGDDPIGAIVLPPVLIEVVNEQFWPGFPWSEIADDYDVWLPMSYWSFRSNESGYGDGYLYSFESIERLRANLGEPDALVHAIGGVGATSAERDFSTPDPIASIEDLSLFVDSLADGSAIGGSIYDWQTTDAESRVEMQRLFTEGRGAELGLDS